MRIPMSSRLHRRAPSKSGPRMQRAAHGYIHMVRGIRSGSEPANGDPRIHAATATSAFRLVLCQLTSTLHANAEHRLGNEVGRGVSDHLTWCPQHRSCQMRWPRSLDGARRLRCRVSGAHACCGTRGISGHRGLLHGVTRVGPRSWGKALEPNA